MLNTKSHSSQKSVPSSRDMLFAMLAFSCFFLLGFTFVAISTNGHLSSGTAHEFLDVGVLICLIFGGLILMSLKKCKMANELDAGGLVTRGEIIALWEDNKSSRRLVRRRHNCYMLYRFEVPVHKQFTASQHVSLPVYTQLQIGAKVRVRFLPDNPHVSRMETNPWKWEY